MFTASRRSEHPGVEALRSFRGSRRSGARVGQRTEAFRGWSRSSCSGFIQCGSIRKDAACSHVNTYRRGASDEFRNPSMLSMTMQIEYLGLPFLKPPNEGTHSSASLAQSALPSFSSCWHNEAGWNIHSRGAVLLSFSSRFVVH